MKVSFKRRLGAYLIDMILIGISIFIVSFFFRSNENVILLNRELAELNEMVLTKGLSLGKYFYQYAEILQDLNQNQVFLYILNAFMILGYFVIFPFFHNNQTFGKQLMKITVKKTNDTPVMMNDLLIRSFIVQGLLFVFLSLASVYLLPSLAYFIVVSIFGFIQILLVIVSVFMVLYRQDKKGLQDILSNTEVIHIEVRK